MDELSDIERHEAGICLGTWGSCDFCDAEDILRADEIKRATRSIRKDGYESVSTT